MSSAEPAATKVSNSTVEPHLRKRKLVRKHQSSSNVKYYVWLAGHIMCLLFGTVMFVFKTLRLKDNYHIGNISYRLTLVGATMAFAATAAHKFGLKFLPPLTTLLAQLNFQYLVLSFVWCFTFKSVLKVIPVFLISFLQLSNHFNVGVIVKQADFLAQIIGFDEIFLIVYLILRTLFFRSTAGYQLVLVLMFLWLRILFDEETAKMFSFIVDKLDGKVSGIKNEKVSKVWKKIRDFINEKASHAGKD